MSGEKLGEIQSIGYIEMPGTRVGAPPPPVPAQAPGRPAEPREQGGAVASPAPPAQAAPAGAAEQGAAPVAARARFGPKVRVGKGTYVSEHASVLGEVMLGDEVFVAPATSLRGDTGAPIRIGSGSNVQDGAIIHAAEGRALTVDNQRYAVFVGERVTLGHRCLVHGPVAIHDDAFVGFGAVVLNASIGRGAVVMHMALVSDVDIPPGRLVPTGTVVNSGEQARALPKVGVEVREMVERVVHANRRYAREYGDGTRR